MVSRRVSAVSNHVAPAGVSRLSSCETLASQAPQYEVWQNCRMGFASLYPSYRCVVRGSDRIPGENVRGTVELVERSLQRRHAVLGDGLRRPAFAALHRTYRAILAEQEDLVHPHTEDLSANVLGGIGKQVGAHRRDLLRAHLLDLLDARLLGFGFGWDGADHAGPGERRDAVRANVEAAHVERDRLRQPDDAELGGGVVG